MSKTRLSFLFMLLGFLSQSFAASDSLVWDQLDSKLAIDAGQVVKGFYVRELDFQPLNRNTVSLSQNARYGSLELSGGLEGILWWPFGSSDLNLPPEQRTIRVEPRLSQAKAKLNFFTQPDQGYVEGGFFPYKYNPDARNLGEYLYRSGTYPGMVSTTDGFHLMDHAVYDALGAHFHLTLLDGLIGQDLNFFAEENILPIGDITPGYELSFSNKFIQLGAGAAYNRFFSFAPRIAAPQTLNNSYIEWDSSGVMVSEPFLAAPGAVQNKIVSGDTSVHYQVLHYWTQRGIKLMARAAVDLGFLIPPRLRGPEDLRFFTEVAVLGWENQPYYYENRAERIPIMMGMNLPTFGLLDLLCFQTEYYAARFDNSYKFLQNSQPVWGAQDFDFAHYNPSNYKRDDWKWSLFAEKKLGRLLRIQAQVANDHLRLPEFDYTLTETDLTQNPSHWYYLVRLQVGG